MKTQANKLEGIGRQSILKKQDHVKPNLEFVDNRREAAIQRKIQDTANSSSRVTQAAQFQVMTELNSPKSAPIQRVLLDSLETINENYLKNYIQNFPQLVLFKNRSAVLKLLKKSTVKIASQDDLLEEIPNILKELGLAKTEPFTKEEGRLDALVNKQHTVSPPIVLKEPAIVSRQSSTSLPSRRVSVKADTSLRDDMVKPKHLIEISDEAKHVMDIYNKGSLLVTAVQRKDLHRMHDAKARVAVSEHLRDGQIHMDPNDANVGGTLAHAKVNWTLTSPRMFPHYFKMINDADRTPKPEPAFDNPIIAPRIATLADPERMGKRFMRGKEGREDLSEWMEDQSSSKTAGVKHGAPLLDFNNPKVSGMFKKIKDHQEETKTDKNPEINTFGFPPEAVVGFLVAGDMDKNLPILMEAKQAMGKELENIRIPVFTWISTGNKEVPWSLKLITHL